MMYAKKRLKTIPQTMTSHKGSDRENRTAWFQQFAQRLYGHFSSRANNRTNVLTDKIFHKYKLRISLQLLPSPCGGAAPSPHTWQSQNQLILYSCSHCRNS